MGKRFRDKHGVEDVRQLLLKLKEEGKTILIASHSSEDIARLCDTVCEMDAGILMAAEAKIDGLGIISPVFAPGTTATANSDSRPSYSTANIRAAAYDGSWHYVQDTGNGDFTVSGW